MAISKIKEKEDQIKLALKTAIEETFPDFSIHEKAIELGLSDSQVSKILGRQKLLRLKEIFKLEEKLKVEIIKVVFSNRNSQNSLEHGKTSLFLANAGLKNNKASKTLFEKLLPNTRSQLLQVIEGLSEKMNPIIEKKQFRLEVRPTSSYISLNVLPEYSNLYNTKGIHLLFCRYKKNDDILRFQFIIPNKYFERELEKKEVIKGGTQTTYLPLRKTGHKADEYIMVGQPYFDIKGDKINENIEKIIRLTLRVYELQSSSSPDRSE